MLGKLKSLGPGLLYAGAAIGVSHLVQSTRAGAQYGYILIIAIILAHFFKYPFFVLGPRYAQENNESLIEGFAKIGNWAIGLVGILTFLTMFTIQAAVTIVTAGLVQKIGNFSCSPILIAILILSICFVILRLGKFNILDHLMKVVMIILSVSTGVAFLFSFKSSLDITNMVHAPFSIKNKEDLHFLIAFVGWMPAPLDIAIWHSIWILIKPQKEQHNTHFDFKVGFYGTALLGICFLILGANTLYSTSVILEATAGGFAAQFIDIFVQNLGPNFYWIIAIAAFTTMFSTTITCLDATPRVMLKIMQQTTENFRWNVLSFWQILTTMGTILILLFFLENMKQMVSFATTLSFLTAPIIAGLCYKVVKNNSTQSLWSPVETKLALCGIFVLTSFSILYIFA